MISSVGPTGIPRSIELRGETIGKNEPAARVEQTGPQVSNSATTAASELASQGAPIDSGKVASIRDAIANGTYKVDAKAIANRMIALDLPSR